MQRFLSVLGVLSTVSVLGVTAQDAGCMSGCNDGVINQFANYGCTSAQDKACLCANTEYQAAVTGCSADTCSADDAQVQDWLSTNFCQGFTSPEDTEGATTTSEPAQTTTAAGEDGTSAPAATKAEPTEAPTTTEALATSESTAASETSGAPAGETASADENDKNDDEATAGGSGLSSGAAVGIGVGVAVCVVAIAVVAIALLLRNRKRKQQTAAQAGQSHNNFSRPMPDSGRSYASVDHGSFAEKRGGESIELTSHRYEDMIPRQTPRTMV